MYFLVVIQCCLIQASHLPVSCFKQKPSLARLAVRWPSAWAVIGPVWRSGLCYFYWFPSFCAKGNTIPILSVCSGHVAPVYFLLQRLTSFMQGPSFQDWSRPFIFFHYCAKILPTAHLPFKILSQKWSVILTPQASVTRKQNALSPWPNITDQKTHRKIQRQVRTHQHWVDFVGNLHPFHFSNLTNHIIIFHPSGASGSL